MCIEYYYMNFCHVSRRPILVAHLPSQSHSQDSRQHSKYVLRENIKLYVYKYVLRTCTILSCVVN